MVKNNKIITLCGSTKFKNEFLKQQKKLTLEGYIVLTPFIYSHSGDGDLVNENNVDMLKELHLRKIDLCDEIFVINVDNYIGHGLIDEINYAKQNNKKIRYLINPF